jgi:pimeloyl-ACP methyl ester carboxylesterase
VAAQVFRLTGLEARVTGGLLEGGDVPAAARLTGLAYETARDAIKSAMRKAGIKRQAEYVSLCIRLEAGEGGHAPALEPLLRDLFGLTERQSSIALASVSGLTRAEVGRMTNVSENIVKSELRAVFDACLVSSIGGLSVVLGQVEVLAGLASASDVDVGLPHGKDSEPLRLLPRSAGRAGRIAYADHGPATGLPTLLLHSATSGRHNAAAHIKALQDGGLRPIALDRPGFGLSDMIEGPYIAQSVLDLIDVMDALNLERASLLCRGGARVLAAFAARFPERLHSAVVVNAEAPPSHDKTFDGILGQTKRLTYQQPHLIQAFGRLMSQHASTDVIERILNALVKDLPIDQATLADPAFKSAFIRATRQAALQGGAGPIAVQTSELQSLPQPLATSSHITLVYGAADPLFNASDAIPHWRTAWPDCGVIMLQDAGRFAQYQRPDVVCSALLGEAVSV